MGSCCQALEQAATSGVRTNVEVRSGVVSAPLDPAMSVRR